MTLKTVPVTGTLYNANGSVAAGASVAATLTTVDTDGGVVVPSSVSATADAGGVFTLNLWPNARGVNGSQYLVRAQMPGALPGVLLMNLRITVPDSDPAVPVPIETITNRRGPDALSDAKAAMIGAQAFAVQALGVLSDAGFVAVRDDLQNIDEVASELANVNAVASGLANVNAVADALADIETVAPHVAQIDTVAGAIAEVSTVALNIADVQVAATNIALIQSAPTYAQTASDQAALAEGFALTATAQASLAQGYAAAAGSVAQQDLSGVVNLKLHGGPNTVVGTCIDDPRTWTDGGAVLERLSGLSYQREVLNGTWLGWQASEACARAMGGTLGAEAITGADPTFASGVGWTTGAGASVTGGVLQLTSVANGVGATTTGTASVIGTVYKVTVAQSLSAGGVRVTYGGVTFDFYGSANEPMYLQATSASNAVSVKAIGTTTGSVDSVSIKPVTANVTNTGDYFGKTGDGKFYSLNAGAGTTETFRGNRANYGRTAWIAEAARVPGYAVDEVGTPMWKVLAAGATNAVRGTSISSITAGNGWLLVGTNSGVTLIDFAKDCAWNWGTGGRSRYLGTLAQANSGLGWIVEDSSKTLASNTVNAVAMTVLPDAPCDPTTGLQVPTIAAATNGGVSVIQNNGSVVSSASTSSYSAVAITPSAITAINTSSSNLAYALNPGTLGASFAISSMGGAAPASLGVYGQRSVVGAGRRGSYVTRNANEVAAYLLRMNEATPAASLVAKIADTYNTGWMPGDIRRAYLADTAVGALADGSTVADRSYKGAALQVHGTLTRTKVGGVSVYSSFSNTNYLQESASSTDLDPATGALHKSFFGSLPAVLPASNFPPVSGEKVVNGSFDTDTDWNKTNPATISIAGGKLSFNNAASGEAATSAAFLTTTAGNWHLLTITTSNWIGLTNLSMRTGAGAFTIINCAPGAGSTTQTILFKAGIGGQTLSLAATSNGCTVDVESISIMEVGPAIAFDRSAAAGAFYRGGCWPDGTLTFSIGDGTTTRTVTSPASYAGVRVKASMSYGTDGTLAFNVNGVQVAATTGTPLGSLSNASAVLTVGNSRDLNAAWPGDLALLKIGMTNPSADASAFMYDTERLMFADGAVCTLPDSGAVVDMDYDALTGKLKVASAANESSFNWLNRVSSAPVSAGSISKVTTKSGIKLVTRTGTNAGVDITIPPKNLQEELNKRAQDAARLAQITQAFDWNGGFTATTAVGSTALTGATGLSIPSGATAVGARVSGTGIPAGAYVTAVVGTTVYISAAATAAGTVPVSFVDVILPVGFEVAADVVVARQLQYEGSTYDYQRAFDGIRERASFNSGAYPAATARVRINARRAA